MTDPVLTSSAVDSGRGSAGSMNAEVLVRRAQPDRFVLVTRDTTEQRRAAGSFQSATKSSDRRTGGRACKAACGAPGGRKDGRRDSPSVGGPERGLTQLSRAEHGAAILRQLVEIRRALGLTELHLPARSTRRRPLGTA